TVLYESTVWYRSTHGALRTTPETLMALVTASSLVSVVSASVPASPPVEPSWGRRPGGMQPSPRGARAAGGAQSGSVRPMAASACTTRPIMAGGARSGAGGLRELRGLRTVSRVRAPASELAGEVLC